MLRLCDGLAHTLMDDALTPNGCIAKRRWAGALSLGAQAQGLFEGSRCFARDKHLRHPGSLAARSLGRRESEAPDPIQPSPPVR
jgi:hypothetical protein